MSVIKPRTRGKRMLRLQSRLDAENMETLYAYARFLGESPEYVLNELVDNVLARDKDYVAWRAEHPEECMPQKLAAAAPRATKTRGPTSVVTVPSAAR